MDFHHLNNGFIKDLQSKQSQYSGKSRCILMSNSVAAAKCPFLECNLKDRKIV